jgi:predicted transcriptional regulator
MQQYTNNNNFMALKDKTKNVKTEIERPYEEIAERLKSWRNQQGIKQEDVGEQFKQVDVYWYESGRRQPTLDYLIHLKKQYGLSIDWILTGEQ